jgi:hypothetical protein
MEVYLYALILLVLMALIIYGIYLVVRVIMIYLRLRQLNVQRNYETVLYTALPGTAMDELTALIPEDYHNKLLIEVLERMGNDSEGELKEKVVYLYRQLGFYDRRLKELEKSGSKKQQQKIREKLAGLDLPTGEEP